MGDDIVIEIGLAMLTRRLTALLLLLAVVLVGAPGTAHAAVTPVVKVKTSSSTVFIGDTVTVSGSVTERSQGAKVRFQRYASGTWSTLLTSTVSSSRTYSFKPLVKYSSNSFRVVVSATRYIKTKGSPTVKVTGLKPPTAAELENVRSVILQQVNEARADASLAPLALSTGLNDVAQRWSQRMASTLKFAHNPNYAMQYPGSCNGAKAENIASGYQLNEVVDGWMNSSGHRANILNPAFTHLGIGYAVNPNDPGRFYRYYTQNFCQER